MTLEKDKRLHLVACIVIAVVVGVVADSPLIGFLVSVAAALAKDFIWDLVLKKGVFDWMDIAWSIVGAVIGTGVCAVILQNAQAQSVRYTVNARCMPGVTTPGVATTNMRFGVNTLGVCVKWNCVSDTQVDTITFCGTWAETLRVPARVDTIRRAEDPLSSLRTAGNRYVIVPLDHPSMEGMPK